MKSLTSRTTLITAVAVAGVLIAGTAGIAANIGILNASSDSSIGSLSATDDLVPSTTLGTGVPMVLEIPTPSTTQAPATVAGTSSYVVDEAGTVSVTATSGGLALVDATSNPGWTPAATQPDPLSLRVAFDNGTRTVVFTATLNADGTIDADVTEPVIVAGATPSKPTTIGTSHSGDDDQYESDDDQYDDDQYDDDQYDDDQYDDDSHEYEGADDDD